MNRFERIGADDAGTQFAALPLSWYKPLALNFLSILRDIRDWISETLSSWPRRKVGAELFYMAAIESFDKQVLDVVDEALDEGSAEQVQTVGLILNEAPPR